MKSPEYLPKRLSLYPVGIKGPVSAGKGLIQVRRNHFSGFIERE